MAGADGGSLEGDRKGAKGSLELQTETRDLPATKNGEKTTIRRSWVFRGSVDGDKMSGVFILSGGDGEPPAQPFTAARKQKYVRDHGRTRPSRI